MKELILFLLIVLNSNLTLAASTEIVDQNVPSSQIYQVVGSGSSMIQFSIPYTFGVHEGNAKKFSGALILNEHDHVQDGEFIINIDELTTGNSIRDCHMVEALGLNYEISNFPKKHVCNLSGGLPATGPNSIAYPQIHLKFLDMSMPRNLYPQLVDAQIQLTLHGVSQVNDLKQVQVTKTIDSTGRIGFLIEGTTSLNLNDFGVQVKPIKIGFAQVGVDPTVQIHFAISILQKSNAQATSSKK